jgi:RNA polymerase sigma-70 factor (ECF subfamily)
MERHGDGVLRTIYLITGDRDASEDLAQETFVKAYHGLSRFRGQSNASTWLYSIAANLAKNHRSRRREFPAEHSFLADRAGATRTHGPEQAAIAAEDVARITDSVLGLPPELRPVVSLYYLAELPIAEIARTLSIPEGTAKSRLFRARELLREVLHDYEPAVTSTTKSKENSHE